MSNQFKIHATLLAGTLALTGLPAWAEEDEKEPITQLLLLSDPIYPQNAGEWQLSTALEYGKADGGHAWLLPVGLEYGITDALEVQIGWNAWNKLELDEGYSESGSGDMAMGIAYTWMDLREGWHLAVGLDVGLPTGNEDKGLGAGETWAEPYVMLATELTGDTLAFAHMGLDHSFEKDVEDNNQPFAIVGAMTRATKNIALSLEYGWSEEEQYLAPGITWIPTTGAWQLGIGLTKGFGDEAEDYRIIGQGMVEF